MTTSLLALDSDKISRLTGIPKSTLTHWERTGIYTPSFVDPVRKTPFRRIYSFRDAVSLRTLSKLRRDLKVPLAEICKAGQYLSQFYDSPWSELRFGVVDRRLVFWDPKRGRWMGHSGQEVLELNVEGIPQEIESSLPSVLERDPAQYGQITTNRYVHHRKPIIAGTRIPTSTIWSFHRKGFTIEDILKDFPHLTEDDVKAAIEYEQRHGAVA
ncbi:MAG: DUF433 domain-containing protein [Chloroflexia bacterium]|jgi:uncharacterized protein (DUF433 family)/DNA-binding transcriptional MerR regulator|nr:DUF433 domain-containing protein [Chloroflexia bacterium]